MIAATIWNKLANTLECNPTLKGYIKNVYKRRRYNIEPNSLPCIMLDIVQNNEAEIDANQYKRLYFTVNIFALSSNNFHNPELTIVGDANYKGILEIENDIRACLQSSNTLGGNVWDIRFEPTIFGEEDGDKYSVTGLMMPVRILYQQQDGA